MNPSRTFGKSSKPGWQVALFWVLIPLGLAVAFYHNFAEMWIRWFPAWNRPGLGLYDRVTNGESYYTHAPLVPAISLIIVVLLVRHTRFEVRARPVLGGLALAASLGLHVLASLARVNFVSGFAFIAVIASLVLLFWGERVLARLWFPIAFLFFMVPLPEFSIASLNFRLKMLATQVGVYVANVLGIIAYSNGNWVFLEGDKSMVVANVCNGLRTLISVIAFGAIYAFVCRVRGGWRLFLFAMSVPVALVANSLRIVSLIVVAHVWTVEIATGWYHDTSGLFIFVLAFLMMFGIEKLILATYRWAGTPYEVRPLFDEVRRETGEDDQWGRLVRGLGRRTAGWLVVVGIVVAGVAAIWLSRPTPSKWNPVLARDAIPETATVEGRTWRSFDIPLDDQTVTVLENPEYLYRRFVPSTAESVDFCIIFSKDNRKGTHPPDLCLEGSGESIVGKGDYVLKDTPEHAEIPCRELFVQDGLKRTYFLYVYKCGEQYTGSFVKQQWIIFVNGLLDRDASGALIRISTPVDEGGDEQARQRVVAFLRMAIPHLDETLR